MLSEVVRAVVVDLDDTLYPQRLFLEGAVEHVARVGETLGLDGTRFAETFRSVLDRGSDSGRTIDETLEVLGCSSAQSSQVLGELVMAFTSYRPRTLPCFPEVQEVLAALTRATKVACLTDGNPELQRAKLEALALTNAFDLVVITDEVVGRRHRKPHRHGLDVIATSLGVPTHEMVLVGDRPDKDVALALATGARAVRVRQGEYRGVPTQEGVVTVEDFPSAVRYVLSEWEVGANDSRW